MRIATIGFTKKSAEEFFEALKAARLPTLVEVRLHRASQLAGFAREDHLPYFLRELAGMQYVVEPLLAPSEELMAAYRGRKLAWDAFAARFEALLVGRDVATRLDRRVFDRGVVLLRSEHDARRCHRRLAAEHLAQRWGDLTIEHL